MSDLGTELRTLIETSLVPVDVEGIVRQRRRRRRQRRLLAIFAGILALTAGTGAIVASRHHKQAVVSVRPLPPTSPSTDTTIPLDALQDLHAALQAWAKFPVHASPRPLVLTSDAVTAPASGFLTTDLKEAFLSGAFITPTTFPRLPAQLSGAPFQYPMLSAAQAFTIMQAEGTPAGGAPRPPTPLRITSIGLGSAVFGTDRGNRLLPAWQFTFQGVADPAAVLAIASSAQFAAPPESLHRSSVGARLAPDGRHLTVSFVGAAAGSGPCTVDYAADQLASVTAVAIRVREIRHGTATTPATVGRTTLGPTSYTCPDVGYLRRVTILLDAQLGDRVLIDATTHGPVQITDWSAHP